MVFLDANISLGVAFYLLSQRRYANWISFNDFTRASRRKNGELARYSPRERRIIRNFFDAIGDRNEFELEYVSPSRMKDPALLHYMTRLMEERYPGRLLYIFYTLDKRFVTQESVKDHADCHYISEGKLLYIPFETPTCFSVNEATAALIRSDFERRLEELIK